MTRNNRFKVFFVYYKIDTKNLFCLFWK